MGPHILWRGWSGGELVSGAFDGTAFDGEAVVLATPIGRLDYLDPFGEGSTTTYDVGRWLSPKVETPFGLTELIASWNATTPVGTWVEVEARGTDDVGAPTGWYVLGRWASHDDGFHRTTVPGQQDDLAFVDCETLKTRARRTLTGWQLRLTLCRAAGAADGPRVTLAGAMASALDTEPDPPSAAGVASVLDVPTYSQQLHRGHYPEWNNGGEAWCSATSTAMVLDYWGAGPTAGETAWVSHGDADPQVDFAVREVFDYAYAGAGNWSFNAAYAASRGLTAFVTRLRSLAEAEVFIAAGIPLVVSTSFTGSELDGAGYDTAGHLMVLVGFDGNGDPVLNDPASHERPSDAEVRVTYGRAQFERAWSRSGRLVYVVRPAGTPLPPAPDEPNW